MKTHAFFDNIRHVEAEHKVAAVSVVRYDAACARDPAALAADELERSDITRCRRRLEGTYQVRIFSEFEAALRDAWARVRTTDPPMEVLINRVADRWNIPTDTTAEVHEVRELRNDLVHLAVPGLNLALSECRSRLCTFLSFIPHAFFLRPKK